jgi:hypothetical protein
MPEEPMYEPPVAEEIAGYAEPEMAVAASEPVEARTQAAAVQQQEENIDIPAFLRRGGL